MVGRILCIGLLLPMLTVANFDLRQAQNDILTDILQEVVEEDNRMSYTTTQSYDNGEGMRCRKAMVMKFLASGALNRFSIKTDENFNSTIFLQLDDIVLSARGARKGGILCNWHPLGGTVRVRNFIASVKLLRDDVNYAPDVDIRGVYFSGMRVQNVYYQVPGLFHFEESAPAWFNAFLENSLNDLLTALIGSNLGKRFDDFLSKKLEDELENIDPNLAAHLSM